MGKETYDGVNLNQ